jgi:hypothetical protein
MSTFLSSMVLLDRAEGYRGDWFPTTVSYQVSPVISGIEPEVSTQVAGLRTEDSHVREGSL